MNAKPTPAQIPPRVRVSAKVIVVGLVVALPLIWVLARALSMDPHKMDAPLIGKLAPRFALPRLSDGKIVTSEDLRGKPVVLNFWSTWCIPCRTEHPVLVHGESQHGQRIQFIGIVYQDRNEVVEQWLDKYGGRAYPTLIDINAKAAIAYGVYGVPETFFIDSQGVIQDKFVGPLSYPLLEQRVARLK